VATPAEIAALPTTPPANLQGYNGPFVGSINSNVYHYPWCQSGIEAKNLVIFPTLADACNAGYRPDKDCDTPACGTPVATATPTPTPVPQAQVVITGPTSPIVGQTATWTVTVTSNGQVMSGAQLANQVDWFIDGQAAGGTWGAGTLSLPITSPMVGTHTLNAEYLGTGLPNTSITITVVG
jgi:hypothetical protein